MLLKLLGRQFLLDRRRLLDQVILPDYVQNILDRRVPLLHLLKHWFRPVFVGEWLLLVDTIGLKVLQLLRIVQCHLNDRINSPLIQENLNNNPVDSNAVDPLDPTVNDPVLVLS